MLRLSVKDEEYLMIGDNVKIVFLGSSGGHTRIMVDAPKEINIVRSKAMENLNSTLRSIESGIPQRCLDIMGCRGFLVTNYQKDLFEYLENGKDMIVYQSVEEAVDKINYYLSHEKERVAIVQNGYAKVKEYFNYHRQLGKIWEISGLK